MEMELFDNVGKSIKEVAKQAANRILATYILLGIGCIALGVACILEIGSAGFLFFIPAPILWYIGNALATEKVMHLYAYGEIVDRLISIESKLSDNQTTSTRSSEPVLTSAPPEAPTFSTPSTATKSSDWECVFCGHHNPANACYCGSCGIAEVNI